MRELTPEHLQCAAEHCQAKASTLPGANGLCMEHWAIAQYACPYCHVKAGEYCIDVRMHRQRRNLNPVLKALQKRRAAHRNRNH